MTQLRHGADVARTPSLLASLLRDLVASRPHLATDLAERVSSLPYYKDGTAASPEALARSCAAHLDYMVADQRNPTATAKVARASGVERGMAGVPLPHLLAAYRVGVQFIWELVAQCALQENGVDSTELVALASEVWLMHDDFASAVEAGWHEAHQEMLVRDLQERASLVDSILRSGGEAPARLWEAADRLGLPRHGKHVVVVVGVNELGINPLPDIEKRLTARRITSAWLMRYELVAGVVATATPDDETVLVAELERAQVTSGVSPRGGDLTAAAQSFRLAAAAAAASKPGTTTRFADEPLSVTVAATPDISYAAALQVFGDLLTLREEDVTVLLGTLRAWFECDGSTKATARALFLHPNSVLNRLHRIEALTGRSLTAPAQIAEIAVALSALRHRA